MAGINDGDKMKKILKITPEDELSDNFINILPASEFVPEWYRKSPSKIPGLNTEIDLLQPKATSSTYKKCTPFFDALTLGYMVFLNADIEVTRKPDGMPYLAWRTDRPMITEHSNDQWTGLLVPDGYSPFVYKWHNPLMINTPKEYSLLFTNPFNRFDSNFITITGLVDTDLYNLSVQFPFFIKKDFVGIIEKGTPIAQIIPVKRDSWEREIHKADPMKTKVLIDKYFATIKRSYKNNHWVRKIYK